MTQFRPGELWIAATFSASESFQLSMSRQYDHKSLETMFQLFFTIKNSNLQFFCGNDKPQHAAAVNKAP